MTKKENAEPGSSKSNKYSKSSSKNYRKNKSSYNKQKSNKQGSQGDKPQFERGRNKSRSNRSNFKTSDSRNPRAKDKSSSSEDKPKFERGKNKSYNKDKKQTSNFKKSRTKYSNTEDNSKFERSNAKKQPHKGKKFSRNNKRNERPRYDNLEQQLPPKVKKKQAQKEKESIRLNRFIAQSGVCSRREADELIRQGKITVNGKIITSMGFQVQKDDVVMYKNARLYSEKLVYVLLNKPKDYITTTDDPQDRKTVMDLVQDAAPERLYPVGRLDRDTTGLLVLTNDGELAQKLSHPSNQVRKIYQVTLDKPLTAVDFDKLILGVVLEDGVAMIDSAAILDDKRFQVGVELHIGRNRIVRRMFEHLGYKVEKLDRTMYAGLDKKELPRGNWRYLSPKEVIRLKFFN